MHLARAHQRRCIHKHQALGIIFLDLQEAFYRTLRELALGSSPSPQLDDWIHKRGVEEDIREALTQHLTQPCATSQAGFSAHHCRQVNALHYATWFHMDKQQDKVLTSIGSRPGDCFADWVFTLLFSRVFSVLENKLGKAGLVERHPHATAPGLHGTIDHDSHSPQLGPTWMDDLAILVTADTAHELVDKSTNVLANLLTTCLEFGMRPNLSAGKTEIMLDFKGEGVRVEDGPFQQWHATSHSCLCWRRV